MSLPIARQADYDLPKWPLGSSQGPWFYRNTIVRKCRSEFQWSLIELIAMPNQSPISVREILVEGRLFREDKSLENFCQVSEEFSRKKGAANRC